MPKKLPKGDLVSSASALLERHLRVARDMPPSPGLASVPRPEAGWSRLMNISDADVDTNNANTERYT